MLRVQGEGFEAVRVRVSGLRCRVLGFGFWVLGLGFRAKFAACRAQDLAGLVRDGEGLHVLRRTHFNLRLPAHATSSIILFRKSTPPPNRQPDISIGSGKQ